MVTVSELFKFQDTISSTSQGNILNVRNRTTLTVEIFGSATSRTVQFYTINTNGDLVPLNGYNQTTSALATSTNGTTSEIWSFDITGLYQICMNVSVISGGNLSVIGRLME